MDMSTANKYILLFAAVCMFATLNSFMYYKNIEIDARTKVIAEGIVQEKRYTDKGCRIDNPCIDRFLKINDKHYLVYDDVYANNKVGSKVTLIRPDENGYTEFFHLVYFLVIVADIIGLIVLFIFCCCAATSTFKWFLNGCKGSIAEY